MFDDCQDMVKNLSGRKFATPQFNILINMRWLPKCFTFLCLQSLKNKINPWFLLSIGFGISRNYRQNGLAYPFLSLRLI
jgi:hypothetical protein